MTTPLPAAAAAMTKDEAVRELQDLIDACDRQKCRSCDATRIALRALTAPAGVPDGYVVAGWQRRSRTETHDWTRWAEWDERDRDEAFPHATGRWQHEYRQVFAAPPSDAPGEGKAVCAKCDGSGYLGGYRENGDCDCYTTPSPAEQGAGEDAGITCARCKGSGEGTVQVGVGPDAYDAPVMCEACGGSGAFDGTEPLRAFPTMLRKMWSGGDVQRWIDENIAPAYAAVCTMARRAAPLAAGRVGVAEQMVGWAHDYLRESGVTVSRHDVKCAIECALRAAKLAGPLVAGEVEAVAWALLSRGRSGTVHRMLLDKCPPDDALGDHQTIRPLVYADTAKAGES